MTIPSFKKRRLESLQGTHGHADSARKAYARGDGPSAGVFGGEPLPASPETADEFRGWLIGFTDLLAASGALVDPSKVGALVIAQFDAFIRAEGAQVLNLAQAAQASGLSADHLARLVRTGQVANAGRRGKPALCKRDLPRRERRGRKATAVALPSIAAGTGATYDAASDARSLGSRKHGGA
jgi:hypothetical protein